MTRFVLASASATRRQILLAAGLDFAVDPPAADEDEIKLALASEAASPRAVAQALAEIKARRVAARHPQALVIGADQVLDLDGALLSKAEDIAAARAQLTRLRGRTHRLITAVVAIRDGAWLWHHMEEAKLAMRDFSDAFLDNYLRGIGPEGLGSVGVYRLEGTGAQLFEHIDGDFFTILGLPLLPLLAFLRAQGAIER